MSHDNQQGERTSSTIDHTIEIDAEKYDRLRRMVEWETAMPEDVSVDGDALTNFFDRYYQTKLPPIKKLMEDEYTFSHMAIQDGELIVVLMTDDLAWYNIQLNKAAEQQA